MNQETTSTGEDMEPFCTIGGNADFLQCLWKAVWRYLKKLKMVLPFDPMIPFLGIYAKEPKTLIQKNRATHIYIAVLLNNRQDMEASQVSINS